MRVSQVTILAENEEAMRGVSEIAYRKADALQDFFEERGFLVVRVYDIQFEDVKVSDDSFSFALWFLFIQENPETVTIWRDGYAFYYLN